MEVWVVKGLWRNDDDFNCDYRIFDTEEKALCCYDEMVRQYIEDFNIDTDEVYTNESNDCKYPYLEYTKCYAEYISGDIDYFSIDVYKQKVD